MSILTKIRQKPDNQKRIFSFVGAGILTIIIFVVWLSFSRVSIETEITDEDKLSSISPMQVIKDEFSKALSNFKDMTSSTTINSSVPVEIIELSTSTSTSTATTTASSTNE
jgi:hypothetical protein